MLLFYAAVSLSCGSVVTGVAMNAVATPAVAGTNIDALAMS